MQQTSELCLSPTYPKHEGPHLEVRLSTARSRPSGPRSGSRKRADHVAVWVSRAGSRLALGLGDAGILLPSMASSPPPGERHASRAVYNFAPCTTPVTEYTCVPVPLLPSGGAGLVHRNKSK